MQSFVDVGLAAGMTDQDQSYLEWKKDQENPGFRQDWTIEQWDALRKEDTDEDDLQRLKELEPTEDEYIIADGLSNLRKKINARSRF